MTGVVREQDGDGYTPAEGDVLAGSRNARLTIAEIDEDEHGVGVCIESAGGLGGTVRYWMPAADVRHRVRHGPWRQLDATTPGGRSE